jgi:hypothetical protein
VSDSQVKEWLGMVDRRRLEKATSCSVIWTPDPPGSQGNDKINGNLTRPSLWPDHGVGGGWLQVGGCIDGQQVLSKRSSQSLIRLARRCRRGKQSSWKIYVRVAHMVSVYRWSTVERRAASCDAGLPHHPAILLHALGLKCNYTM